METQSSDGPHQRQAPDRTSDGNGVQRPVAAQPSSGPAPARRPDAGLSDDGQLLEAGYGHGV